MQIVTVFVVDIIKIVSRDEQRQIKPYENQLSNKWMEQQTSFFKGPCHHVCWLTHAFGCDWIKLPHYKVSKWNKTLLWRLSGESFIHFRGRASSGGIHSFMQLNSVTAVTITTCWLHVVLWHEESNFLHTVYSPKVVMFVKSKSHRVHNLILHECNVLDLLWN